MNLPLLDESTTLERASQINDTLEKHGAAKVKQAWARREHPKQYFDSLGEYADSDTLKEIATEIEELAREHGWPNIPSSKSWGPRFDTELAFVLHRRLAEHGFTRHNASRQEAWCFLCTVLVPHVVAFRWGHLKTEYALRGRYCGGRRQALGRLWWRVECLGSGDDASDKNLFENLGEDGLVQMQERAATFFPSKTLARATARLLIEIADETGKKSGARAAKHIRRGLAFVCPDAIDDEDEMLDLLRRLHIPSPS